jgi:fructose-bisphosphate aldolase class II
LAIIREFGGNMKETYGVPVEEIQKAIQFGVRKINIDTDIRLGHDRRRASSSWHENPDKFDPRDWLKPAREAAKQICKAALHPVWLPRTGVSKIRGHTPAQWSRRKYAQG